MSKFLGLVRFLQLVNANFFLVPSFELLTLPDLRGVEQTPQRFCSITFYGDKIVKRDFG